MRPGTLTTEGGSATLWWRRGLAAPAQNHPARPLSHQLPHAPPCCVALSHSPLAPCLRGGWSESCSVSPLGRLSVLQTSASPRFDLLRARASGHAKPGSETCQERRRDRVESTSEREVRGETERRERRWTRSRGGGSSGETRPPAPDAQSSFPEATQHCSSQDAFGRCGSTHGYSGQRIITQH